MTTPASQAACPKLSSIGAQTPVSRSTRVFDGNFFPVARDTAIGSKRENYDESAWCNAIFIEWIQKIKAAVNSCAVMKVLC